MIFTIIEMFIEVSVGFVDIFDVSAQTESSFRYIRKFIYYLYI